MATIQIADKPTLDAVKIAVDGIKTTVNKDSYPNVSSGSIDTGSLNITGKGKIMACATQTNDLNFMVDGVKVDLGKFALRLGTYVIPFPITFERSFQKSNINSDFSYILQLSN